MSSDTETPERESENPHVEQRQSAGDDCWRSARHLGQVGSAVHESILGALHGVLSVTDEFALFLFSL